METASVYAITGGTGSLGTRLTHHLLKQGHRVRVIARSEPAHLKLIQSLPVQLAKNLSTFIGDVRDRDRLFRAFDGADYVIHAAAMKVIPLCATNPMDGIKTNITGTMNVVDACLDRGVKRAVFISSDKACSPSTAYGAQKLAGEHLWLAANKYCGAKPKVFSAVRYGNVFGSAGSILHTFMSQAQRNEITITDDRCTRFHLRMSGAIDLVLNALHKIEPGEMLVPKLPAYRVTDFAQAIAPKASVKMIGLRAVEKIHESMLNENESPYAVELPDSFVVNFGGEGKGKRFDYNSGAPAWKMSKDDILKEFEEWKKENA